MSFKVELIAMAPEIFLISIIQYLIIYGVICTTSSHLNYPILVNNLSWLSLQVLFFLGLMTSYNPLTYTLAFNDLLILDEFSSFIKTIIIVATACTILISLKYNHFERINAFESIILLLLAVTGILLLISSFNLVSIYLAIELQSFCLYILAALNRTSEFSTEAGLKYFVLGAFSSGLLLFGLSLIYGFTGILNLGDLFQFLSVSPYNVYVINGINLASLFILVGLLFKLSAVPFHLWAPDIYEGAPTTTTAFFASVPKIGILALLTRFAYLGFYDIFFSWQELFVISAICSILLGTFGALMQLKLKRLLAYSAIGHMGFMLIGFSCGCFEGIHATFVYIVLYMMMAIVSFTFLLGIYQKKKLTRLHYLKDLTILTNSNPLIALSIAFVFFSMAGIPPLAGFFSKMFLFIVAIQSSMYTIAIIVVLTSVISCFYYIRVIKLVFFDTSYLWVPLVRLDREKSIMVSVITTFLVCFAIYPLPIIYSVQNVLYFIVRNQFDLFYT
jgi:proton-translocating NADH-quinone oxidoreductase chain N